MENLLEKLFPFLTRDMVRFGREAKLQIQIISQSRTSVNLTVRFFTREGISEFRHTNTGTGGEQTSTHDISDLPILLSVTNESGANLQGDAYVQCVLLMNGEQVYEMCAGYVYRRKGISWPGNASNDVIPGRSGIRSVIGTNPAAGQEIEEVVPNGQIWRILAVTFTLACDANAANRYIHVFFQDDNGLKIVGRHNEFITANQTRAVTVAPYGSETTDPQNTETFIMIPPEIYLPSLGTITTVTDSIQAGDNYSAPVILIEQFYTVES